MEGGAVLSQFHQRPVYLSTTTYLGTPDLTSTSTSMPYWQLYKWSSWLLHKLTSRPSLPKEIKAPLHSLKCHLNQAKPNTTAEVHA